ncbi:MAG: hypothetical protein ABI780_01290 [Ardenticatenales bacterium]
MTRRVLVDHPGTYGGPRSRDEIIRLLKDALALVEYTASDARLECAGLHIEETDPGTPPRDAT